MTLRETIKELCKANGISLNRLESELGLAKGYVSKLDKSVPNSSNLKRIANYFNVSIDSLMSGNTDNQENFVDDDLRKIERARSKMSQQDREKMIKILKASFEEYFND